jgi:pilus assembly protein CpaF
MEGDVVTMHEIFKFRRLATDPDGTIHGEFVATGIRPVFMNEFETRGIEVSPDMFEPNRSME